MPLTGAGLGQMRASLRKLAAVPSRAAPAVAEKIDQRLQDCFANETDPYGNAWAPLAASTVKRKRGNTVIMYRTGKARAQTHAVAARGAGIKIEIGEVMKYHMEQDGTRPARRILPTFGMPKAWNADVKAALDAAFARAVKR
jgi:hypothetical protein